MTVEDWKEELGQFLESWKDTPSSTRNVFLRLREHLESKGDVIFNFHSRPGVSYSLRAAHPLQKERQLFAMIDVIDDDPENRWISVCFYGDLITDPEEKGDLIPQGLLGEDGYCFDMEEWDEERLNYIKDRIDEAYRQAAVL